MFSTRQGGGDGFIVWGGMSKEGLTELYICDKPINSSYYCEILKAVYFVMLKKNSRKVFGFNKTMQAHTSQNTP